MHEGNIKNKQSCKENKLEIDMSQKRLLILSYVDMAKTKG